MNFVHRLVQRSIGSSLLERLVCPIGLRIGITEDWRSRWYADKKKFGEYVVEDEKIRRRLEGSWGEGNVDGGAPQ